MLNQQLIGPLTLKLSTEYNLDKNSSKYNEFHKKKYEIIFALYINKYLNPDRIYRAPFLYVEIVPANDPDRTCYM